MAPVFFCPPTGVRAWRGHAPSHNRLATLSGGTARQTLTAGYAHEFNSAPGETVVQGQL